MAGVTNKGKVRILDIAFRNQNIPTNLYVALITSAVAPTADTNTFSELTEITAGNNYTAGGYSLSRNTTDFDSLVEDDTNDMGELQIKNVEWTASGGNIPASGNGARYAILTDDNGTQSAREILAYWDLSSDRTVSDGQTLRLVDLELDLTET